MNITQQSRMIIRNLKVLRVVQIPRTCPAIVKRQQKFTFNFPTRNFCSVFSKSPDYLQDSQLLDLKIFDPICSQTLESLTDYFEEIVEADSKFQSADVNYSVS